MIMTIAFTRSNQNVPKSSKYMLVTVVEGVPQQEIGPEDASLNNLRGHRSAHGHIQVLLQTNKNQHSKFEIN
jgi:hypothetical protein